MPWHQGRPAYTAQMLAFNKNAHRRIAADAFPAPIHQTKTHRQAVDRCVRQQVLSMTAGSPDYSSSITRRNAKINKAALLFDIGETDRAVTAYRDIIR